MALRIVPLELRDLNALVAAHHRHHKPVQGHRFSIGVALDGVVVGGASVGRPTARMTDQAAVLEVTRLVTTGVRNACSALYGACARAGKAIGYQRIQTFILESETGDSLMAVGWNPIDSEGFACGCRRIFPERKSCVRCISSGGKLDACKQTQQTARPTAGCKATLGNKTDLRIEDTMADTKRTTEAWEYLAETAYDFVNNESGMKEDYKPVLMAGYSVALQHLAYALGLPVETEDMEDYSPVCKRIRARFPTPRTKP